ncbi:EamA family transporter RarD [Parasphingorhabdus halotolerans]|uniref:EamA family transporter RarD n=1 Tax=Parasphingorhabdus halotolerans TaxID=2725558 RepID=A0A6H2DM99_9SPHN|nr:EamA family transporter RarD [Parasphingorhabdus halotolerans]QJB69802.1 EamA family transporter RarD [Parasphingorhabdus halotolerans]
MNDIANNPSAGSRLGLVQALLACLFWGVMPIYFKLLEDVAAIEVVAHRVIWTVPLLLVILYFRKNITGLLSSWADKKIRWTLLASSLLIAANWLIYVWAVQEDHILAASLGYFISPLLSVFLGRIFLKETLSRNQWVAVGIAALGVSVLAVEAWQTLWISLALAASWSGYALVRKVADVGPIVGLTIETSVLLPFFGLFLLWVSFGSGYSADTVHLGDSLPIDILLLGGAVVTAAPLMLFASAVKKMTLSAIGLLNYLAPTLQFLIGVMIYREPLTISHIICFGLIWISLAIFSADSIRKERTRRTELAI